jgi:transposase
MQAAKLDTAVINYINELKAGYEHRIQELQNQFEVSLKEFKFKYMEIKEQYDLLVYKRFARSAEQLIADEKQQMLFANEPEPGQSSEAAAEIKPEEITGVKSFKRRKAGRKAIDPKIPREARVIDIPESEKTCACGAKLNRIGEETSEKLHIIPMRIFVEQIIRLKYACRCCEGTEDEDNPSVRIAPVEPSIIPKSIASPGLLSAIFTQKFEMHLPYYRQEIQFEQIGVLISRQNMCNWQRQAYDNLTPLFDLLKAAVKDGPVLQMDETTVQVMGEGGRPDTQDSFMWLALGGLPGKTVSRYEYHETRAAYNAEAFLEGYSGYLQTDEYKGYETAVKNMPGIIPKFPPYKLTYNL